MSSISSEPISFSIILSKLYLGQRAKQIILQPSMAGPCGAKVHQQEAALN